MNITLVEYTGICTTEIDPSKFSGLVRAAVRHINLYTRRYYDWHSFEDDYEWRKKAVKEAIALQVEYLHINNATSSDKLNNTPQSVTLGRTSISHASRFNASGSNEKKPLVCLDAQLALAGTGLVGRGL